MRLVPVVVGSAFVLALTGCSRAELGSAGPSTMVAGDLSPADPSSPGSPWVGQEIFESTDANGNVICEAEWVLAAVEVPGERTTAGCGLELELLRTPVWELTPGCVDTEAHPDVSFFSFVHDGIDRPLATGSVMSSPSRTGPWTRYGGAFLEEGHLFWSGH